MIPAGEQAVLSPSVFVLTGTMPLAFTVYGVVAYALIASLFLVVRDGLTGPGRFEDFKFGAAYCLIWAVCLFEPLPHVAPLDRITYPLADEVALLVLGVLAGRWLTRERPAMREGHRTGGKAIPILAITALFVLGRLFQYEGIGIYSSFGEDPAGPRPENGCGRGGCHDRLPGARSGRVSNRNDIRPPTRGGLIGIRHPARDQDDGFTRDASRPVFPPSGSRRYGHREARHRALR